MTSIYKDDRCFCLITCPKNLASSFSIMALCREGLPIGFGVMAQVQYEKLTCDKHLRGVSLSLPVEDANPTQASAQIQSDLGLFRERESVFYIDTQVPYRVLNLRVTKQYLDCPDIAGSFVDDRGLRSTKRMCAIFLRT